MTMNASPKLMTIDDLRQYIADNISALRDSAARLKLKTQYETLQAIALLPIFPENAAQLKRLGRVLKTVRYGSILYTYMAGVITDHKYALSLQDFVTKYLKQDELAHDVQESLDWLMVASGCLVTISNIDNEKQGFAKKLLEELRTTTDIRSGMRVQAEMLTAGENIYIAGRDINIAKQSYQGDDEALRAYLSKMRSEWNYPELGSILPGHNPITMGAIRLHHLYTHVDVWKDDQQSQASIEAMLALRSKSIDLDLIDARRPALEVIATHPYLVITGAQGSGKSALCRYMVTSLAYACDEAAAEEDGVNGLSMLGSSWVHNAILPLYVRISNFCADKSVFPTSGATASSLLAYLRKTTDTLASELDTYLMGKKGDKTPYNAILILDGLDETYATEDRIIMQQIIENWADRYPKCRILMTSRPYAYKEDAAWRLSKRFKTAELAPYTWKQVETYITSWYEQAARQRASSFGGSAAASAHTQTLAKSLVKTLRDERSLWMLARQPIMLTMLALIHEDNRKLPSKRAELYQQTVDLLDRWNISLPDDTLAKKLVHLNHEQLRGTLKIIAFELQKQQVGYTSSPQAIERRDLFFHLDRRRNQGGDLGASSEDVIEYLSTRNGILVSDDPASDKLQHYRFPHLSVQEYLAACALIELYDECVLPDNLKPSNSDGWTFPENLTQLLRHDPYRWRNVVLFAGSVFATEIGQDRRWNLIEMLIPEKLDTPIAEEFLVSIYVAAEIWAEGWIKPRTHSQRIIRERLINALDAIHDDHRLDAPERVNAKHIQKKLREEVALNI